MENFGILRAAVMLTLSGIAFGRPTTDYGVETEEIKIFRAQVAMLRQVRPCYARLLEVKADIKQYDEIMGDPHYVPECDKEGIKWRPAQCDHHEEGACFCVHEENGEVLEHSRDLKLNKEALACGRRAENNDHTGHECFHMKDEFNHMQKEYGLSGHSPLPYYPECTMKGKFMAMQRNDMSKFFCVDTNTGKIIPETETEAGKMPPLTENICQAYDEVWQEFKSWNSSHDVELHNKEVANQSSCGKGLTFTECGCPLICTHKTTLESITETDCVCKPACICPNGMLELDGRCISLEECNEAKPPSKVPQADKLDDLTAGDYSRWKEYKENNPNAVLEAYNLIGKEEIMYAGGPVAYDENPNGGMFIQEPPPEEGSEYVGHYRGEPIPFTGEGRPILRQVLSEGGPNPEEVRQIHQEENYAEEVSTYPPEEEESYNEEWFSEEEESFENVEYPRESEFSQEEETTEEVYFPEETSENEFFVPHEEETVFEVEEDEISKPVSEEEEGNAIQEEDAIKVVDSRDSFPEEEEEREINQEKEIENVQPQGETENFVEEYPEEEYFPTENAETNEETENPKEEYPTYHRNEFPEEESITPNGEEGDNTQPEEETENVEHPIEHQSEEEEENPIPSEEKVQNIQPLEESNNFRVDYPTEHQGEEINEPEHETDERVIKEELSDHQTAFSSVPKPEHDVEQEHQTSPPCEEGEETPQLENTEKEENGEDLAEIDRVLIENSEIPPIEATFEKQTQSVKKNVAG